MEIKDLLKARRLEKGLTLDEVAHMVGVSAPTISRWESGDIANMRRDKIAKLAQALDVSPAVIMGWDMSPSASPSPNDYVLLNDNEKLLIESYRSSDEDTKRMVDRLLAYARAMNKDSNS